MTKSKVGAIRKRFGDRWGSVDGDGGILGLKDPEMVH